MNVNSHVHSGSCWLVTLSALACVLYSGGALAASPSGDAAPMTVSFGDLNLSTSAGAERLYGRIQNAARIVCGSQPSNVDILGTQVWKSCYKSAVSNAVASVNFPTLTALHDGKSGRRSSRLASR